LKKALIALYFSYTARYLTSFLSIPFLARVLGRKGLGDLAMMTSIAVAVAVWVEYGVGSSALREISSADPEGRGGILIGVMAANLALFASAPLNNRTAAEALQRPCENSAANAFY
jgi:O-antigen/teichoic acid export membrane protein